MYHSSLRDVRRDVGQSPVTGAMLEQFAAMYDRLGPAATIDRQPAPDGRGHLWTIHTRCAGAVGMGQGGSLGEALRDLHAVQMPKVAA